MQNLKIGNYKKVRILKTDIAELQNCIDKYGKLCVLMKNQIIFETVNERHKFKVMQSQGDFSSVSCDELWVGVSEGEITFKRVVNNPLWVR